MSIDFLLRLSGLRKPKSANTLPLLAKHSIFCTRGFTSDVASTALFEVFAVVDGVFKFHF